MNFVEIRNKALPITIILIAVIFALSFLYAKYQLEQSPIYSDFIHLDNKLSASNLTIQENNTLTYLLIKSNIEFLDTYYAGFIQISILVATTLIGLYSIVFIDIIKAIKRFKNGTLFAKIIRGSLVVSVVLPLIFLLISVYSAYVTFRMYTNIFWGANTYLVFYNYTTSNPSIIYTIYNNTASNASVILLPKLAKDIVAFPNVLLNGIFLYLEIGIMLVIANLLLYWFYTSLKDVNEVS